MKYKCILVQEYQHWLTVGNIYDGEIAVTPRAFAGWIEIRRADDGWPAFVSASQMAGYRDLTGNKDLTV